MPFLVCVFNTLVGNFIVVRISAKFEMTLMLALLKRACFFRRYDSVNDFDFLCNYLRSFFDPACLPEL